MAIRYSTGLRNALAGNDDLVKALANGRLFIYIGAQPTSPDTGADAYTNVLIFTKDGGAYTEPVRAAGTLTLSGDGAGGGSVDTVTLGGMAENILGGSVSWNADLATTTDDVAAAINAYSDTLGITAESDGVDTVTLYAPYRLGSAAAGLTIAVTYTAGTTLAVAKVDFTGGTDAVNGLNLTFPPAAGVVTKDSDTWQGTVLTSGNAGWFRFVAGGSSPDGDSTTDIRMDGTIATGGGDMTVSSIALTAAAVEVFSSFQLTIPAS